METSSVAPDDSRVLKVKLGRETSLVAHSADKRSKKGYHSLQKVHERIIYNYLFKNGILMENKGLDLEQEPYFFTRCYCVPNPLLPTPRIGEIQDGTFDIFDRA